MNHQLNQDFQLIIKELNSLLNIEPSLSNLTNIEANLPNFFIKIKHIISLAQDQKLDITALTQCLFYLNNIVITAGSDYLMRWQYVEAAVKELVLFNNNLHDHLNPAMVDTNLDDMQALSALEQLPLEIIDHISSFLSHHSLKQLKKTNRFFNNVAYHQLKKQLKAVIATGHDAYFLLSTGQAFIKIENRPYFEIKLSNHLPIKEIITSHACVFYVDINNHIHTAGTNACGQMGKTFSYVIDPYTPVFFTWNSNHAVKTIINGGFRAYVQNDKNIWFGYGNNKHNELGITRDLGHVDTATPLFSATIDKIVCGFAHTFFLSNNQWYGWGYSGHGELGTLHDQPAHRGSAVVINLPDNKEIADIAAGDSTSFFKTTEGDWYACGDNHHGSLGLKFYDPKQTHINSNVTTPTRISLPNNKKIIHIVCRYSCTYIQDEDGHWYGCGQNYDNQLGIKQINQDIDTPTPICLTTSAHTIKNINFGDRTSFFQTHRNEWWQFGGKAKSLKKFNINTLEFEEPEEESSINTYCNLF